MGRISDLFFNFAYMYGNILQQKAAVMNAEERSLWALIVKGCKSGQMSKTALAALLTELAMKLEASDVAKLLKTLEI